MGMVPREVSYTGSCFQIDSHHFVLRYHSTAALVALVLVAGPKSPHKILNQFVKKNTNFRPTDGEKWCAGEPDIGNIIIKKSMGWEFNRLGM
jgi:hypothetical protein